MNFSSPHFLVAGGWLKRNVIHSARLINNGGKADEDAMEVIDRYHLDDLKRKKTQAKAACTTLQEQEEN